MFFRNSYRRRERTEPAPLGTSVGGRYHSTHYGGKRYSRKRRDERKRKRRTKYRR